MARPLRIEFSGAVYLVSSRGNGGNLVYRYEEDRLAFLETLGRTVERWDWIVHAYCLMGNQYVLAIETPEPNLSRGMRQLNGEYTQTFNRRHHRAGHLFQGRFKAVLVEKDSHLLDVCRFVVLSPVRGRGAKAGGPEDWRWSSYRATAGKEKPPEWLTVSWILSRFGKSASRARQGYRRFVARGLEEKTRIDVRGGLWIGSDEFGKALRERLEGRAEDREHTRLQCGMLDGKGLKAYFPAKVLKSTAARDEAIYRAYREGRHTQRKIGEHLGLHYVTISRIVRRLEAAKRQAAGSKGAAGTRKSARKGKS